MHAIERALAFALQVHEGQTDRAGLPYILHPLYLMMQVETEMEKLAAILHDTIEDSERTLADIEALEMPAVVVRAVALLTHDRANVPYLDYVRRLRPDPIARRVKLADLQHNMDIRRLPEVTEQDLARFVNYRQAWEILTHQ